MSSALYKQSTLFAKPIELEHHCRSYFSVDWRRVGAMSGTSENELGATLIDSAAIIAVLLVLAVVHFIVPSSLQQMLAFNHDRFSGYTLLTAAYVHNTDPHLFGNILGYLLATSYGYMLCIAVDERRWFRRTFVVFLFVLPILVSLSSYAIFSTQYPSTSPTSRGFSGVVAGFGGFLLVALAVYLRNRYSAALGQAVGYGSFFVLMALVDFIYTGTVGLEVGGLVSVGLAFVGGAYVLENDLRLGRLKDLGVVRDVLGVVLVFVVLAFLIVNMFPADVVSNGSVTNIWAHAIGFLIGIVLSLATIYSAITNS